MKTIAIIQARLGSTRLPRKVLRDIAGQTMIQRVINRVRQCQRVDGIVIATTLLQQDRELVQYCQHQNWDWFAGSEQDVLQRYLKAAELHGADRIVRITSDCPLIDPALIDQVIECLDANPQADYACNFYPSRHFPRGLDCEAMTLETLRRLDQLATEPPHREHVTLYAYRNPDQFSIASVLSASDWSHFRWTVDTEQDWQLVQAIYRYFGTTKFGWQDLVQAYRANPDWIEINKNSIQKVA